MQVGARHPRAPACRPSDIRWSMPDDLTTLTARTLAHYDEGAVSFWEGTRDHDVTQNYAAFLRYIEGVSPWTILDFGCGPGRDLAYFRELGHDPVGLDGSAEFVAMARAYSGCEVVQRDFLRLDLVGQWEGRFDGVFANASLFHVPGSEIARVLAELRATLKPRGVLFSSNPRGDNREGWTGDRYGCYHDLEAWRALVVAAGFEELTHYFRPTGLPPSEQPWLASVWRRLG